MLTDTKIRTTKPAEKPIRLPDSGGMYLEIRPNGSRLWRMYYRIAGKRNLYAIGAYPEITLQDARKAREAAKELIKQGIHPSRHRQTATDEKLSANQATFKAVSDQFLALRKSSWSASYQSQFERGLRMYILPKIGKMPIATIKPAHILQIMNDANSKGGPVVAIACRAFVGRVFRHAIISLLCEYDPSAPLSGYIKRGDIEHARPYDYKALVKAMQDYQGKRQTAIGVELLTLTALRTGELIGGIWGEIDWARNQWAIPANRMKMRRPHIVPLTEKAVALLRELKGITGKSEIMFPNKRDKRRPMCRLSIMRAMQYSGFKEHSGHDARATFSTAAHESGLWRSEVIEMQLSHADSNVIRGIYNHAAYLDERRRMMEWWASEVYS
jgi:integrase